MSETIAALATAYGIGSVSIVRLSGKDALAISLKLLKLSNLEPRYAKLAKIYSLDDEILVQFDEPIFVTDKNEELLLPLITKVYNELTGVASNIKIVFATYFEHAIKAVSEVAKTKIYGIALDFIHGKRNFEALETIKNSHLTLFAGVIDGRNIWKSRLNPLWSRIGRIFASFILMTAPPIVQKQFCKACRKSMEGG